MPSVTPRIAVVIPGDPALAVDMTTNRWVKVFETITAADAEPVPVVYRHDVGTELVTTLTQCDAVLVWINPIVDGHSRAPLDEMLRQVAASGVFVSAHPDVIQKMGTKDVLFQTRDLPWGTDTRLYPSWDALHAGVHETPPTGARVLKQRRGQDGNGVWRIALVDPRDSASDPPVQFQQALRGAEQIVIPLSQALERCRPYFAADNGMVDQPYQPRLADGMVRCYMTHDRVVGFGHQLVTALLPPAAGELAPPEAPPRLYYGPDREEFQGLRALLETGWIVAMQQVLDVPTDDLPVIWDADFLYGPRDAAGDDTYVLCEINVSSVFAIPDEAFAPLVDATLQQIGRRGIKKP